jgi:hypothetical protein
MTERSPISGVYQIWWIPALPYIYFILRYVPILELQPGFPSASTLFASVFALDLIANGLWIVLFSLTSNEKYVSGDAADRRLVGGLFVGCGLTVALVYYQQYSYVQRKGGTPTFALSATIYTYLLLYGLCNTIGVLLERDTPPLAYGFGTIHIFFPLIFLTFRGRIYRTLARTWLRQRFAADVSDRDSKQHGIPAEMGSIVDVEEAIAAGIDLNRMVRLEGASDELTLLTLACLNGHQDAASKLLTIGHIDINKPSKYRQWTPLYACCRQGDAHTVKMLISRGVNVNSTTSDGESALLHFTACGHTEIIRLLIEAGASQTDEWMGLNLAEAARTLRQNSALKLLRAYESAFEGNVLNVQGCNCVVSWPGIYARSWDALVAQSKADSISAAVVFIPEQVVPIVVRIMVLYRSLN